MPGVSPELYSVSDAPSTLTTDVTSTSTRDAKSGAAQSATAVKEEQKRSKESSLGASSAPPPPPSSSSSSSRQLDCVIYADYEILVQFRSPYPLDELRAESGEKALLATDDGKTKGQERVAGGRFGKKKASGSSEGAKEKSSRTVGHAERSAGEAGGSATFPVPGSSQGATNETASMTVDGDSPLTFRGSKARGPADHETDGISCSPTAAHRSPSNPSLAECTVDHPATSSRMSTESARVGYDLLLPDSQATSATSASNDAEQVYPLPFQLPVPLPAPSSLISPVSLSSPADVRAPTPLASQLPSTTPTPQPIASTSAVPAPIPNQSPTTNTNERTARGQRGRFLPKPPGQSQKAKRAAARAAKAVAGPASPATNPDGTPYLTQRQQREIARKAREERMKIESEKEKEEERLREKERLYVCEKCFKYFALAEVYTAHQKDCDIDRPPGQRVYQRGATSIWEVDGATAKLYCQNLCLFAKLFIEHKYMFYDVEGFSFYLLTETMGKQEWVLGYFSKEKLSYDDYNLACIVVFPPFRQKGWATLLIEFSYELSRRLSATPGTPERPLSELGEKGYLAHWTAVLVRYFRAIFALRAEPPHIDAVLAAAADSSATRLSSSPVKNGDEEHERRKRIRRSKGWDGELPAGAVTLASTLSSSPAKAFTLRLRPAGPRQALSLQDNQPDGFSFPTTLDDLAEAVNLRPDDVAFAMVESGLARYRRAVSPEASAAGGEEVKVETDDEKDEEQGKGKQRDDEVVITPELIELVARACRVREMPILDVSSGFAARTRTSNSTWAAPSAMSTLLLRPGLISTRAFPALARRCFAMSPSISQRKPAILLADEIKLATSVYEELEQKVEFVPLSSSSREEFIQDCQTKYKECSGLYRHFNRDSNRILGKYDYELVKALPESLKYFASNGAGYDAIDVAACTSRQIQFANVPTVVDAPTADTALFLLLGALRQFGRAQKNLRDGKWHQDLGLSNDPAGKVLGILGMGGIGRAFAHRARALGMTIIYHNRSQLSPELEGGATYVASLDDLLSTSDVVSLNLPLTPKTRHTMGVEQFKKMKRSAVLINTARGGVVDEAALVEALKSGEIAGCGLDVYEDEPRVHPGLLAGPAAEKAFLLPHVGTLTVETQREMEAVCLQNIVHGLETGKMSFTVAEQKGAF
ncbi:hypothetical protein JCM11641_004495 [Rhodosporidiobolus odoratus]